MQRSVHGRYGRSNNEWDAHVKFTAAVQDESWNIASA